VLVTGARAPRLITREMLGLMPKNSVIVDVAVDQGGCVETTHATTHSNPTYFVDDVLHYGVANMPGGRAAHVELCPLERDAALRHQAGERRTTRLC